MRRYFRRWLDKKIREFQLQILSDFTFFLKAGLEETQHDLQGYYYPEAWDSDFKNKVKFWHKEMVKQAVCKIKEDEKVLYNSIPKQINTIIDSEKFIDDIIERIKRKQIG
jgi:hypothetical protein